MRSLGRCALDIVLEAFYPGLEFVHVGLEAFDMVAVELLVSCLIKCNTAHELA